jgi:ribosomal protein S27AE
MNVIPNKCPNCGARDFDVQVVAWCSYSNGKSNEFSPFDTGMEEIPNANANCPSCGHEWRLEEAKK